MDLGVDFLKSRVARRFSLLFILCAFVPTVVLIAISYQKVSGELEQQSIRRLKHEANAYGMALFDRMIRLDHELRIITRLISNAPNAPLDAAAAVGLEEIFAGVVILRPGERLEPIVGVIDPEQLQKLLGDADLADEKTFVLSNSAGSGPGRVFFGVNGRGGGAQSFAVIGEVRSDYLWGAGANPLLPPLTELTVYDRNGQGIMATENSPDGEYRDLKRRQHDDDPRVFAYQHRGEIFFASAVNIFFESRFQRTGWLILLSQARSDVMAAMDSFRQTFPVIILFLLLLILYLSMRFIRKNLEPLKRLTEGTRRVADRDFSRRVEITSNDEFEDLGHAFNEMTGQLDKQFVALQLLAEIDRAILSSLDRKEILATTLLRTREFFGCTTTFFIKHSRQSPGHIKVYTMFGRRMEDPNISYHTSSEEERGLLFSGEPARFLRDGEIQPLLASLAAECRSFLCLPVVFDHSADRLLIFGWTESPDLGEDAIAQAGQIANQLAVALANSRLVEDLEKLAIGTIEALARTVDAKSKWTSGHSERVAELSATIGRNMGLAEKEINSLQRGGLLHDIGKIGISMAILDKPGRLDEKEYAAVCEHPAIGARILEPITAYQDILPMVAQHHERYDGSGYPEGLRGEEIDLRARIMAVADVWDAVVSDRPYREGWIHDRAKKLIIDGAGSHFDPEVVEVFLAVVAEA